MSESEFPIGRQPPPAWMVAPRQQLLTPVPPALPAPPAVIPLPPIPVIAAAPVLRSRHSGMEANLRQVRPWNLPAWK